MTGSATEGGADSQSHYSNILSSVSGSATSVPTVDESYRRIGQHLSWNAHGGDSEAIRSAMYKARLPSPRIGLKSPSSSFRPFQEVLQNTIREREQEEGSSNGNNSNSSSTSKDHIVRKMTLSATKLYRLWQTEHKRANHHKNRRSSGRSSSRTRKNERHNDKDDMSSNRRAFAQMSLSDGSHIHTHSHNRSHNNMLSSTSKKQPGSLTAVIESASQNSSTATRSTITKNRNPNGVGGNRAASGGRGDGSGSVRSEDKSRASSSIATRSSMGTRTSFRSFGEPSPRGICLTHPSEGVSNENLCDNIEGNLIVYENDNISVPKKQVCVLTSDKIPTRARTSDFRVQSLLGQGTFAQVFRCLHIQTGQLVAVKIVKNQPAYTRQAAVEIDVIRALTMAPNGTANKKNTNNNKGRGSNDVEEPSQKSSSDHMIDMVCYFLYKDHLCLVFELLGLNLYEVLKKRQFRGLPLDVTQTLVRQAVMGTKMLAQRSIVHCDLKPENILLVDEDDSESVMSAGDRRGDDRSNGGKTHSSDKIKSTNDTDSTNKDSKQQTDTSDNSNITTETNNTRKGKDQLQQQEQPQPAETVLRSKYSTKEKSNIRPTSKAPMESTIATYENNEIKPNPACSHRIKLIDFGSACFEGQMSHTYIQSRFYRSPEVLLGLAYDSAIDMWSLGCVAAELFLGLPILPGVHEHDQLGRIIEMIGDIPDWMLDQGTKSSKYFGKFVPVPAQAPNAPIQPSSTATTEGRPGSTEAAALGRSGTEAPRPLPQWRIKNQHEYIDSLSQSDIKKKGGLAKLQKQPGNRYFKRTLLSDIILHKGQSGKQEDLRQLKSFIHFLYGILDPDPWKRWTAFQVASHPFCTGEPIEENIDSSTIKDGNHANRLFNLYWEAPTDPTIYRRKLLNVQKTREKQQAARRNFNRGYSHSRSRSVSPSSQDGLPTVRNLSKTTSQGDDTQSGTSQTDEEINQLGGRFARQGSYQGSFNAPATTSHQGISHGVRLLGYDSGTQLGFSGPQSFSETGCSVGVPGSFNEGDFALALHRPGVVPMGNSVTTATTSTTSMSSGNNSLSNYNQNNNHTSQIGSYGTNLVADHGNQERLLTADNIYRTSRSFGERDIVPAVPIVIGSGHQQVLYSSSHEDGMDIGPPIEVKTPVEISVDPPTELESEEIPQRPRSTTSKKTAGQPPPPSFPKKTQTQSEDDSAAATTSNTATNHFQLRQNLGVYDSPQIYQQQLAAMQQQFQQQQLLLQQQQAALVLQQEQLRVYYSAAGMNVQQFGIPGAPANPTAAINTQQFGIPDTSTTPVPNASATPGISGQQYGTAGATAPTASINPQQFGIAGAPPAATPTVNAQQFSLSGSAQLAPVQTTASQFGHPSAPTQVQGGGYFVVTNADGTQMIVQSNQAIPIAAGQLPGITPTIPGIFPGQLPGLSDGPTQMQVMPPTALPTVPPGTAIAGMPGIQGMHATGIIASTGGMPGVGLPGMAAIPAIISNTSPVPNGRYPNNDQQQYLQHQI